MTERNMKPTEGQSIVAVDTADKIGTVKHFVVSPDASRVLRLHIDGRGKKATFVEWDELESFGSDRVMVTHAADPSGSDDDRDIAAAKGKFELLGSRVLDTAGFEHGTVADAVFDADTGMIVAIINDGGERVEKANVHSLGSYAVVIDA